jgi:hypothetical protein
MGLSMESTGSFTWGFLSGTLLAAGSLAVLVYVMQEWTSSWLTAGGKARVKSMVDSAPSSRIAENGSVVLVTE